MNRLYRRTSVRLYDSNPILFVKIRSVQLPDFVKVVGDLTFQEWFRTAIWILYVHLRLHDKIWCTESRRTSQSRK